MGSNAETKLRCPICRLPATVLIRWVERGGTLHAEVSEFRCPSGDRVDAETIREIIGAQ